MSWSIPLVRLFGIQVYVHATFFLLLAFFGWMAYQQSNNDISAALNAMFLVILLFGIIVMHELGHALMARRFGVPTRDITLLPIGGVARLERIPENPYQEFAIAVAGPAVNVVLAILCFAIILARGRFRPESAFDITSPNLVNWLFGVNVMLVLFNMIPAFPMDGGRVLRSVLAMGMDHLRATQIAATVGKLFAMLFGLVALITMQPMLFLIALFVWVGASAEAQAVETKSTLAGVRVKHAMISDFRSVDASDTLEAVAGHVLAGFQQDFPVMEGGQVVGVITRGDMLKALAQVGRHAAVADVMQRRFVTTSPEESLNDVMQKLQECECHSLPVLEDGQLVGMITTENIGEYLMIRSAVRQSHAQRT